jgi:hypothetical protein
MSTTLMILEADKKSHLALHDWFLTEEACE